MLGVYIVKNTGEVIFSSQVSTINVDANLLSGITSSIYAFIKSGKGKWDVILRAKQVDSLSVVRIKLHLKRFPRHVVRRTALNSCLVTSSLTLKKFKPSTNAKKINMFIVSRLYYQRI